ncbi:MAG TPA: dockerin type I repeat-containing protein [Syntrophomonadaceae bacterium]|mgnify:CR=1 FL=1|nr:dockerin type I repeat-containing protein [Syntrophomonadaceae bacterium]HPR94434.1 dockerin type I repeat-containing protein [Syntrophomonadaceae bacterium]
MYRKKRSAFFLLVFFVFFIFSPVNYAAAYTASDAAAELANVYKYIDVNDKPSISNARLEAQELSDPELDLLTDGLVNALSPLLYDETQKAAVQEELRGCFRDLALIVYDESTVESDLVDYKNAHSGTFQKLFGTSFTVDDLYGLLLAMREEMPRVIYQSSTYAQVVESGSDAELIAQIPNIAKDAAVNVLANPEYEDFADKLVEIGWTTQMLTDTYIEVCNAIDDESNSAELALVKAAVRSQIYLYLCDKDENIIEEIAADELSQREVTVQQPAYFQAYIGSQNIASPNSNANVTTWFLWDSSNAQIIINDSYPGGQGTTLELTGVVGDTGTIIGYRDAGMNGDPVADWLVKFDVAVAGEGVAVDGTITSWDDINDDAIVKLYDPTYSDADIRADMKNGTPVNAIENVATLGTPTYDSVSKRYNQSFSFADVSAGDYKVAIYKTGKYVVKVATISMGVTNIDTGALKLWLYGDVNDDGIINSSDHQRLFEHLNGTNLLTGDALLAGDVNKDENTNSSDHQRLFEHLNGTNPLS